MRRPIGYLGYPSPHKVDTLIEQPVIELLISLTRSSHVDIEVVDLGAGTLLDKVRQVERGHAAHLRAPAIRVLIARTDAVNNPHRLWLASIPHLKHTTGRPGGIDQTLDFQRLIYVLVLPVPVIGISLCVEGPESGRENDGPDVDLLDALLLFEVDGVAFGAGLHACLLALPSLELDARIRIDKDLLRYGLREGKIDGLALTQSLIESVGCFALFVDAGGNAFLASDAQVLDNVAGLSAHRNLIVADVAFHLRDLRIRPKRDIRMGADTRHLWREDAGGAVEGRKGFVEHCHVPADRGLPFHQVHMFAGIGHGEC